MAFWQFGYEERWASLTVRVISFKISNYVHDHYSVSTNVTRQTETGGQSTCNRKTALSAIVHRAVKTHHTVKCIMFKCSN